MLFPGIWFSRFFFFSRLFFISFLLFSHSLWGYWHTYTMRSNSSRPACSSCWLVKKNNNSSLSLFLKKQKFVFLKLHFCDLIVQNYYRVHVECVLCVSSKNRFLFFRLLVSLPPCCVVDTNDRIYFSRFFFPPIDFPMSRTDISCCDSKDPEWLL